VSFARPVSLVVRRLWTSTGILINEMKLDYKLPRSTIRKLKDGNPDAAEQAIQFLVSDVYAFGSGYLKESIWNYLMRVQLTERQKQRLQHVALKYLNRKMTREYSYMCRLMSGLREDHFEGEVKLLTTSVNEAIKKRAKLL
jgi:hypothetical protein